MLSLADPLWTGMTLAVFHKTGKVHSVILLFSISHMGEAITLAAKRRNLEVIPSVPTEFVLFRLSIKSLTSKHTYILSMLKITSKNN